MKHGISSFRPTLPGATHTVATPYDLAISAAYRILEQGGNAVDAGIAAGIVLNVVSPQPTSFGGVATTLDLQRGRTAPPIRSAFAKTFERLMQVGSG